MKQEHINFTILSVFHKKDRRGSLSDEESEVIFNKNVSLSHYSFKIILLVKLIKEYMLNLNWVENN